MVRAAIAIFLLLSCSIPSAKAFDLNGRRKTLRLSSAASNNLGYESENRRNLLLDCGVLSLLALTSIPNNAKALASYSANAKNLERINSGDFSGGSSYDNNPKAESGRKRRAMVGCKNPVAREEAAELLQSTSLTEKDCNQRVLGGESEFMLQALRNLDCPTCPYGIKASKD